MRPHGSPVKLEERRKEAVRWASTGLGPTAIGLRLGVTARSVRRWLEVYRARGRDGLKAKPASGRPCKLTKTQRKDLRRRLLRGAACHGFFTDLWTCRRVAQLIRRQYNVRYHVDSLPYLLRLLRFTPQKPELRARERDEHAIETWRTKTWACLKKSPAA